MADREGQRMGAPAARRHDQDLLIVFARALEVGKVKTRLIPAVGEQGALRVYRQLLDTTLVAAHDFPGQVELWTDRPDVTLAARARRAGWGCHVQRGADLGARMSSAIAQGLQTYRRVLLVGSDCPLLHHGYFHQALDALNAADVVLGASEDGGYVLLGSARPRIWKRNPFSMVRWGTEHALSDSLSALALRSRRVATLAALWDVDEPQDLSRAVHEGLIKG